MPRGLIRYALRCALVLLPALGGLALIYLGDASRPFLPCPFRALTGWYCPGCGAARAVHAYLHLHVWQAFLFNPLLPFLAALLLLVAGPGLVRFCTGVQVRDRVPSARALIVFAAAVAVFTVLRNLPLPFLAFLKPF